MANSSLAYRRAVRAFGQQPTIIQVTAVAVVAVLVVGLAALGVKGTSSGKKANVATGKRAPAATPAGNRAATASSSSGSDAAGAGSAGPAGGSGPGTAGTGDGLPVVGGGVLGGPGDTTGAACPSFALTGSDTGVTAEKVKVVFPWFDLTQYTDVSGTSTDDPIEGGEQAIQAFVNYVNDPASVCLGGRTIDAQIESFNPLDENDMQAKCRQWTEDDQVFAVVDSAAWHSYHQQCIAKDHHTPLLTSLGLTKEWAEDGAPYLWYTAPTTEETVADWVSWMVEANELNADSVIGVITGTRPEEQQGQAAIKAALDHFHLQAEYVSIAGVTPDELAAAQGTMGLAISQLKEKHVDRLVMGLTALAFTTWAKQADTQEFYPRYELSDWNSTLVVSEALISTDGPQSSPDAFKNGAIGPSFIHLGEKSVTAGGTMTPAEQRCADIWHNAFPNADPIDRAGVAMRWCDNILMFAEGVRRATLSNNGSLTRDGWAAAMATIQGVQGGMTDEYSFASGDYSGPTRTKTVKLHIHEADFCTAMGDTDAYCLEEIAPYTAMRRIE